MTIKQFLTLFAKRASISSWDTDNAIRHRVTGHCPLSWVAHFRNKKIQPCAVFDSAQALGLTEKDADKIADAADYRTPSDIRRVLVAAIR